MPRGSELDLCCSACTGTEVSISTIGAYFAMASYGKGLTVSAHTLKIPSCSLKKYRPLWPVMIDDNVPKHKRRKLVKKFNNVLPRKKRDCGC